jgi:hypothetical protein
MIYDYPDKTVPIKQGDIFYPLPRTYLDLGSLLVLDETGSIRYTNWQEVKERHEIVVNVPLNTAWGIVATQSCDALRSPLISLFEIGPLEEITRLSLPNSPKKWVDFITQKSRLNARWFYLPPDEKIGFSKRMAINFEIVLQISRENLEDYINELRKGRLNEIAYEHYRESVAQYFRRYPYDEWYALNKEELTEYKREKEDIEPFDWQR